MLTLTRDRTHMPALDKTRCVTIRSSAGLGFSIGRPGWVNVECACMKKYDKTLSNFLPNLSGDSVEDITCSTVEVVDVVTVKLFNQKCDYFPHCSRGDYCKYLHDEIPTSTVFHDGSESCQTRTFSVTKRVAKSFDKAFVAASNSPSPDEQDAMDVRLFVSNIPNEMRETELRAIASKYGKVTVVQLLHSSVTSGRRAGFIHMESRRAAKAAIAALQNTTFTDALGYDHVMAKVQKELPLPKPASMGEPKAPIVDADGFTTIKSSSKKQQRNTPTPSAAKPTSFSILDDADEEVIVATMQPRATKSKPKTDKKPAAKKEMAAPVDEWPSIASLSAIPDLEPIEQEDSTVAGTIDATPTSIMALSPWAERTRVDKLRETLGKKDDATPRPSSAPLPVPMMPMMTRAEAAFKPIALASTLAAMNVDSDDEDDEELLHQENYQDGFDDATAGLQVKCDIEFEEGVDDWEVYAD